MRANETKESCNLPQVVQLKGKQNPKIEQEEINSKLCSLAIRQSPFPVTGWAPQAPVGAGGAASLYEIRRVWLQHLCTHLL